MSVATDALLQLATVLSEMPTDDPMRPSLWANPLICTHALYAAAEAEAEGAEADALKTAMLDGYIVPTDDVTRKSAALATRVFYVNRAERRKREREGR